MIMTKQKSQLEIVCVGKLENSENYSKACLPAADFDSYGELWQFDELAIKFGDV